MCKKLDGSSHSATSADPTLSSSSNTEEPSGPQTPESSPSIGMNKKTVSFQNVEVAQYPMELGDNPSANGLPITIGWECDFKLIFELEEYETTRPEPRSRDQFWMPSQYREDMLSRQGVTGSEMLRTSKEMKRIQKSRHRSIKNQKWDKLHLLMEESGRKLKKVTSVTSLKKQSSANSLMDELGGSSSSLGSSSSFSSSKLRMPKSTSMTSLLGLSKKRSKSKEFGARDPLDESTKSKISIHLLHHPEELLLEDDESPSDDPSSDLHLELTLKIKSIEAEHEDPGSSLLYDPSIEF